MVRTWGIRVAYELGSGGILVGGFEEVFVTEGESQVVCR